MWCAVHVDMQNSKISSNERYDAFANSLLSLLVVLGTDIVTCSTYCVAVYRHIVCENMDDFFEALAMAFAIHFIYNINYSSKCAAILEYIQR